MLSMFNDSSVSDRKILLGAFYLDRSDVNQCEKKPKGRELK